MRNINQRSFEDGKQAVGSGSPQVIPFGVSTDGHLSNCSDDEESLEQHQKMREEEENETQEMKNLKTSIDTRLKERETLRENMKKLSNQEMVANLKEHLRVERLEAKAAKKNKLQIHHLFARIPRRHCTHSTAGPVATCALFAWESLGGADGSNVLRLCVVARFW